MTSGPWNSLVEYLEASATRHGDRVAVVGPDGGDLTFGELNGQADALARFLSIHGIVAGDRVGVVLPKSNAAVVSLFGIMKAGAVFVPVDSSTPADRGRTILEDCQVRALVVDSRRLDVVPASERSALSSLAALITVGTVGEDSVWPHATPFPAALSGSREPLTRVRNADDLAYILYTSGSTGVPKGVMISHENAISFVEWCSATFAPTEDDRFSSHAPFHFDLSVLDIYLPIKHGATLYLISEELGKNPKDLARFIAAHRLTVWYSTPSILTLLLQFGNLPAHDLSNLRLVLFAGEVFPVKHLRELRRQLPHPACYNLYGPTETNVCTFARIPERIPPDRDTPYPIGFPCAHCEALVLDEERREMRVGDEGLLYIAGPSVFRGYWNRPVENARAFLDRDGKRWYNTGDVVRWDAADGFIYLGRKDRMVKRRGYRIELGEIERILHLHPRVREAAVISHDDPEAGLKIVAFLSLHAGERPSIVEMKTFCGSRLPAYMNPDQFVFQDRLPKTSTDKMDYQALKAQPLAARAG
jgi:amino acid adenylation domain-containing protein